MPVSREVASTRALAIAWLSGPATRPIRMSVVEPTWATPSVGFMRASAHTSADKPISFDFISNHLHAIQTSDATSPERRRGHSLYLRLRPRDCWKVDTGWCHRPGGLHDRPVAKSLADVNRSDLGGLLEVCNGARDLEHPVV